jgi:isopenicillin-N N-acyltransferase-like protein
VSSSAPATSFLAQNWDWQNEQTPNLIALAITQNNKPTIKMITEAGLIGKIGLNSSGVGVCLNAIKAPGISYDKLPCHLALRLCLDSPSAEAALTKLKHYGIASSCHLLLADSITGGVSIEASALDIVTIPQNEKGQVFHSNHFIAKHSVESKLYLPDSLFRLNRIREIVDDLGATEPGIKVIEDLLDDEKGYPTAICREKTEKSTVASLFSIVMDLSNKKACVRVGRPVVSKERVELGF